MTDPAIIEAAARALFASEMPGSDWCVFPSLHDKFRAKATTIARLAETILTAATPLIRAQALEEAAKRTEDWLQCRGHTVYSRELAAAIRALKEQP